ncbi:hypothetical protein BpHYR1_042735 [Brachionus plicatilis]|uniref:MULE transposase domain-containing protein n=1 Tax=Brachionus plicatilis TaxID=10195 RepID=A0A3M7SAP1_BRAPC|nr:hypothetical protein BpHYR1_042735 [Brachionus plicatilis]
MVYYQTRNKRLNCDFEKAAINAFRLVFKCEIHGCFLHLSQAWFKRINEKIKEWNSNESFRSTFRKLQSLAVLPSRDVNTGFDIIKKNIPMDLKVLVTYLEKNYIGSKNKAARFPIEFWNFLERVKPDLPRTNKNLGTLKLNLTQETI